MCQEDVLILIMIMMIMPQVFDGTPAAKDGTLQSGDEIVAVNGTSVKGKSKVEVAKMIQSVSSSVIINYNKLHADLKEGKSLDIILKKMKHRMVDNMSSATADALGLSRAILCNDTLVKKMNELEATEFMYRGMAEHIRSILRAHVDLCHVLKEFGDIFAQIGVREPQPQASEALSKFGEVHRSVEKKGIDMLRSVKTVSRVREGEMTFPSHFFILIIIVIFIPIRLE